MPIEQILASIVMVAAVARMAWLVARPAHHTEASWTRAQVRMDDWLASRVQTRA